MNANSSLKFLRGDREIDLENARPNAFKGVHVQQLLKMVEREMEEVEDENKQCE